MLVKECIRSANSFKKKVAEKKSLVDEKIIIIPRSL